MALVVRVVVMVVVGFLATNRAEETEARADTGLKLEEEIERTWNARDAHGDTIREIMVERAKCDSALESFSRHRNDPEDWAHVLNYCHTEGEIE